MHDHPRNGPGWLPGVNHCAQFRPGQDRRRVVVHVPPPRTPAIAIGPREEPGLELALADCLVDSRHLWLEAEATRKRHIHVALPWISKRLRR
jgi:hypothetical protein